MTPHRARSVLLLLAALSVWFVLETPARSSPATGSRLHLPFVTGGLALALQPHARLPNVTAMAPTGDGRLLAALIDGRVYVVAADGTVDPRPFLDIGDRLAQDYWEQGLLGLALHPDFAANGLFYVYYSASKAGAAAGAGVLARYRVGTDGAADPSSEVRLLEIAHTRPLHYGGDLAFGPDGFLYLASGDDGDASLGVQPPPLPNAQNGANLLGKVLRLDVAGAAPYAIPADNPFAGDDGIRDEIWVMGLRNPWRFSFDRATGDVWIADVGEARLEEINQVPSGGGGNNFGWPCYEGLLQGTQSTGCGPAGSYDAPRYVYSHTSDRCAVTGGYVYRGAAQPRLAGQYLFADFCSGEVWALPAAGSSTARLVGAFPGHRWSTFGQDAAGELYLGEFRGSATIYHLRAAP